ncbi:MAG: outer membrane beta-barrel protein [Bryobacterales bacterium]|nr:porin [Bryobacteraceae bacterium]MDW8128912.1 outer membrane beta-barrel protein [Bryobacterales bacterium]
MQLQVLLDANYSWNRNRPQSRTNRFRMFDHRGNAGDISYGEIALETPAEPFGVRVDLGMGRTTYFVHGAERGGQSLRYVQQAYVTLKPWRGSAWQLDFGKFVTSAGAEVIEADQNWNYSRSLLFSWAVPFYHFGLRTTTQLRPGYSAGFQLVQGWNNVRDNNQTKTVGFTGTWSRGPLQWFHAYYRGREQPDLDGVAQAGVRQLLDTTLLVTPTQKSAFYVNADFGSEGQESGSALWYGVAVAGRLELTKQWAGALRLEWFRDRDGLATGVPQTLKEITLTGEYRLFAARGQSLKWRVEYRRDWSNQPVFERRAGLPPVGHQDTFLVGLLFGFGAAF